MFNKCTYKWYRYTFAFIINSSSPHRDTFFYILLRCKYICSWRWGNNWFSTPATTRPHRDRAISAPQLPSSPLDSQGITHHIKIHSYNFRDLFSRCTSKEHINIYISDRIYSCRVRYVDMVWLLVAVQYENVRSTIENIHLLCWLRVTRYFHDVRVCVWMCV